MTTIIERRRDGKRKEKADASGNDIEGRLSGPSGDQHYANGDEVGRFEKNPIQGDQ